MATPDFVLSLREHIGHAPLPLVGVTAVIVRDGEVLLGRRADNDLSHVDEFHRRKIAAALRDTGSAEFFGGQ